MTTRAEEIKHFEDQAGTPQRRVLLLEQQIALRGLVVEPLWIANNKPIIAELTRRVCTIFTNDDIRRTIPAWRGCAAELAAVDANLKEYDALRPRR